MAEFRLRDIHHPSEHIIPETSYEIDMETAHQECKDTAEKLAEKTSGFGEIPAERYLLRFEYGFSGKELKEASNVSLSTISKQTMGLRREILKFPTLSRIIGRFRSSRVDLTQPDLQDTELFNSEITLDGNQIDVTVTYHSGEPGRPYSWKYRLEARSKGDETAKSLLVDYLVDAEYGVLLKRRLRGVSHSLSSREPHCQDKRQYIVYPLPNPKVPRQDNTLMEAVEYHAAYDLDLVYNHIPWDLLESKLDTEPYTKARSPAYSEDETLLDRLKLTVSTDPINEYAQEQHLRDNLEHLLRVYPLEELSELPSETIDVLWNGSLEVYSPDGNAHTALSKALETSEVHRILANKGY
jgi:hypothetical protein